MITLLYGTSNILSLKVLEGIKSDDSMFKRAATDKKGHLVAYLDRCQVFLHSIREAVEQGASYGTSDVASDETVIINPLPFVEISEDVSLDNIRALLLSQHIAALLNANGSVFVAIY